MRLALLILQTMLVAAMLWLLAAVTQFSFSQSFVAQIPEPVPFCGTQPSVSHYTMPANGPDGKALFMANCASCHTLTKDLTGPALQDVRSRWPNNTLLVTWIKDWEKAVASGDPYPAAIQDWSTTSMQKFPGLTDAEIEEILRYCGN